MRRFVPLVAATMVPLLLATSCGYGPMPRQLRGPSDVSAVIEQGRARDGYLKAHLRDGGVALFTSWRVDEPGRLISGPGWRFDASRDRGVPGPLEVSLDSVVAFESNLAPERLHPAIQALLVVVGIAVGAVLVAVISVAIFGSCPTFYVWDGEQVVLAAEGFSSSVAPSLEATDLDALPQAKHRNGELEVVMLNEMLETHVVRGVRVLAAPRQGAERVFAGTDGAFHRASGIRAPARALGSEGDCAPLLRERDGAERFSRSDSTDLAATETLDLEFEPGGEGPSGLVVTSRHTLMTTFLFYKALAWMGRSAPEWMAALETAPARVRKRAGEMGGLLGGMRVEVHDGRRWIQAGEIHESGPLATDERIVPLPVSHGAVRRVRLIMAKGMWRLDRVALARLGERVEPARLDPVRVERQASLSGEPLGMIESSGSPLVTLRGDRYTFTFRLPQDPDDHELFLESRGYYLEWIRNQWLEEENAGRLQALLTRPREMLRTLAPEFKRQETELETRFWEGVRGRL